MTYVTAPGIDTEVPEWMFKCSDTKKCFWEVLPDW